MEGVVKVEWDGGERGVPTCGCVLVHVSFLLVRVHMDGVGGEEGVRRDLWLLCGGV